MSWDSLFSPKVVAVVGATPDEKKVGFAVVKNLQDNKALKIIAINPFEREVLGLKCQKSLAEVPEKIDLAVIAVSAKATLQVLKNCPKGKVDFAVIIAAGFKEVGTEGAKLESELISIAKDKKIRLIGPNCLGVLNVQTNLNASFLANSPKAGKISFISQSGAIISTFADLSVNEGVGFGKIISLGNGADLNELDFIDYLAKDNQTKAAAIYLENISDGMKFLSKVSQLADKKPVVILRAGRSGEGVKSVLSHTGALASDEKVFEAACRQAGIILVDSVEEFFNICKLFQLGIYKETPNIALVSNGGGVLAVATDHIEMSETLCLVSFNQTIKRDLEKALPSYSTIKNPLDIIGDADSERYERVLKIIQKQQEIDAVIVMLTPQMMSQSYEIAQVLIKISRSLKIIPVFIGWSAVKDACRELSSNGLVNFSFPNLPIQALDKLNQAYGLSKKKLKNRSETHSGKTMVSWQHLKGLLKSVSLNIEGDFLQSHQQIVLSLKKQKERTYKSIWTEKFALKAYASSIIHKTEHKAVAVNLKNESEVLSAWKEIERSNVKKEIEGFVLQPMIEGFEVIVGAKRDPIFGPIVMVGMGGVLAEVLKDTVIRIGVVNQKEAISMLSQLKDSAVLKGYRGSPAVDISALSKIINKVSLLICKNSDIQEIDLNPVIVNPKGAFIVDARVIV